MPLSDFKAATGDRIMRGKSGVVYENVGRITFQREPVIGIDSNLWGLLKASVDSLKLAIWVSSIDTGAHVATSRHYSGRAADIDLIAPIDGRQRICTAHDEVTLEWVRDLRENGWHAGEGGDWPAILLGPVHTALNPSGIAHDRHLHVSIAPHA